MATRSLICVFFEGEWVVAQRSEYDGYPEGQGYKVLRFLATPGNVEHLRDGLQHIYTPTDQDLEATKNNLPEVERMTQEDSWRHTTFQDVYSFGNSPLTAYWPSLSKEAGARILTLIAQPDLPIGRKKRLPIVKELEFANSLFCRWTYVIDLDRREFEVFEGSQKKADAISPRFHEVGGEGDTVPKLIKSFKLNDLPASEREFHEALKGNDDQ